MQRKLLAKWATPAVTLVFALIVAASFFHGCSQNPVSPDSAVIGQGVPNDEFDGPQLGRSFDDGADQADYFFDEEGWTYDEREADMLADWSGGTLQISFIDGSEYEFNVPEKALRDETKIKVKGRAVLTRHGSVFIFECGPDGTVFERPLKIIHQTKADVKKLKLFYFDEETGKWKLQGVSKVVDGEAVFYLKHFSKYGISR